MAACRKCSREICLEPNLCAECAVKVLRERDKMLELLKEIMQPVPVGQTSLSPVRFNMQRWANKAKRLISELEEA